MSDPYKDYFMASLEGVEIANDPKSTKEEIEDARANAVQKFEIAVAFYKITEEVFA